MKVGQKVFYKDFECKITNIFTDEGKEYAEIMPDWEDAIKMPIEVETRLLLDRENWYEGTELCGECGMESNFIFYPSKGDTIICEHCGHEMHPCSLCEECDGNCEENMRRLRNEI